MKKKKLISIFCIIIIISLICSSLVIAITELDNSIMKIYTTSGGLEIDELKGFDIQGYVTTDESTNEKTLISSTFSDDGYHTFLNVNGLSGEMDSKLTSVEGGQTWKEKAKSMQYTEVDGEGWQTINGINIKVSTQFINNGEQLQIVYDLKNTTTSSSTISLATAADVQIDEDDSATIERLEDGSGIRLWTKEGRTKKPVQFVFYGKDVPGTTSIDKSWIGYWGWGDNIKNMFTDNSSVEKIKDRDSSFAYSWVNRTINAGETQTYSVLMEVGEINIPNTGIAIDNQKKLYYKDAKINGQVIDKDLKDKITVHYTVDGTEYTLPAMSTTGTAKDFTLDLTSLNLEAVTPHTLKVWATDSTDCESNVEERTFTITYLKEPELIISPNTNDWSNNSTFTIKDNINSSYVKNYQYRINEGSWINCEKNSSLPIETNGERVKIDVRIEGTETNDYSNIVTGYAKVDREPPTVTVPTIGEVTTCSIIANANQRDLLSGIDELKTLYSIKVGDIWSEWQTSNKFSELQDNKEYYIKTKSTDNAGNTSESQEVLVKTKKLKEAVIVSKDEFVNEYISFKLTSQNDDENLIYQYKINEGEWKNTNKEQYINITNILNGEVKIEARIINEIGISTPVASKTVSVSIKPELEFSADITIREKEDSKYIRISPSYTLDMLKAKVNREKLFGYEEAYSNLTADNQPKTGTEISLEGELKYIVIVNGDVNCDGNVTFLEDIVMANNYRLGRIRLNEIQVLAVDLNDDNKIDFIDEIVRVNNYRIGVLKSL